MGKNWLSRMTLHPVPERRKVLNVDILLNTRKGVAVSYSTEQIA